MIFNDEVPYYQKVQNADEATEELFERISDQPYGFGDWVVRHCLDTSWSDHDQLDDLVVQRIKEFMQGDFYKNLDYDDQLLFQRTMSLDPEIAKWGYGEQEITDQTTLFYMQEPVYTQPFCPAEYLILSGVLGRVMIEDEDYSNIVDKVEKIKSSELNKAIIVGGLVMASVQHRFDLNGSAKYYSYANHDNLSDVIEIGGSEHGDFRMAQYSEPVNYVIDPLGNKRPFGPLLPEKLVAGYHSIETLIQNQALIQLAGTYGIDKAKEVAKQLLSETDDILAVAGPFADYGDRSNEWLRTDSLKNDLELLKEHGFDEWIDKMRGFCFGEGSFSGNFTIRQTKSGIFFTNHPESETPNGIMIANEEIKDFMLTLIQNQGGRTSPHNLRNVLKAFIKMEI